MSKIGFGHQVTVHISQHFHHSEVMEEVDNEIKKIKKHQLWVDSCVSQQPRGGKKDTESLINLSLTPTN